MLDQRNLLKVLRHTAASRVGVFIELRRLVMVLTAAEELRLEGVLVAGMASNIQANFARMGSQ